jgi:predicted dehydrogenase
MRKIRAGLIGAGFIGPLHLDAIRRLGYVDVVAIAESNQDLARSKAEALGIETGYGSYHDLLADSSIEAVHVCTPNYLHHQVSIDALKAGKHVLCDKPLALTVNDAREMRDYAHQKGLVNAITFNYRFNPLVQQARTMVSRGELGQLRVVHGQYLQDWLMYETDFTWRLEPDKGGPSCAMGDIGSHLCDTAQFITGLKIVRVLSSLSTTIPVRKKPSTSREAFAKGSESEALEDFQVKTDDLGTVIAEFEGGVRGSFLVGQVCAGHKNDMQIEVNGSKASLRWVQENPNEMWMGLRDQPSRAIVRDPGLIDPSVRYFTQLPGGHPEGWADAFRNLMSNFYSFIAKGLDPVRDREKIDFGTFEDGYRAVCVVDAIVRSSAEGSRWVSVEY